MYIQSDILLPADVFETFCSKCIETYELDPAHFLSAPRLACLRNTEIELELLKDSNMQLIIEKGIRGRICHAIRLYANVNKKYTKGYNKENESPSLIHWMGNVNKFIRMGNVSPVTYRQF